MEILLFDEDFLLITKNHWFCRYSFRKFQFELLPFSLLELLSLLLFVGQKSAGAGVLKYVIYACEFHVCHFANDLKMLLMKDSLHLRYIFLVTVAFYLELLPVVVFYSSLVVLF
jgi:hypothetical protein